MNLLAKTLGASALMALLLVGTNGYTQPLTDAQIRAVIIRQSIASYPGTCACPYNVARNGSSCGRRSAYSRGGGYAPMCYASDVSDAAVAAYRRGH